MAIRGLDSHNLSRLPCKMVSTNFFEVTDIDADHISLYETPSFHIPERENKKTFSHNTHPPMFLISCGAKYIHCVIQAGKMSSPSFLYIVLNTSN